MHSSRSITRVARHLSAYLFAALATSYALVWIGHIRHAQPGPGFTEYEYSQPTRSMTVGAVIPRSPADQAGLRPGDQIVGIDRKTLDNLRPFYDSVIVGGNAFLDLVIKDPGSTSGFRQLRLVLHGRRPESRPTNRLENLLTVPLNYYPLGFLLVGVAVLLLRPDDPNAWLLALLFGGFVGAGPLFESAVPVYLRGFAVAYKMIMASAAGSLFYYFFAVFPAASHIDRKIPWLKHALLAVVVIDTVPIAVWCLIAGGSLPLYLNAHWPAGTTLIWALVGQTGLPVPGSHRWPSPQSAFFAYFFGTSALGLASLISNSFLASDAQTRRKARVILWGTVVGVSAVVLIFGAATVRGAAVVPMLAWEISIVLLSTVWPLSFAYAVVKHRVLEIPVLLRRSARYVLVQRGFTISLLVLWLAAIRLFFYIVSRLVGTFSNTVLVLGLVFGLALVWISAPTVKRTTTRIDRAFFRSAYDARVTLQELAEKTRSVTNRRELARLLEIQIEGALHPQSLAVYLEAADGSFVAQPVLPSDERASTAHRLAGPTFPFRFGAVFVPRELDTIPATLPLVREIAQRGKAWDVPQAHEAAGDLGPLAPECVVPILGRNSSLLGLVVLGPRLSEEPYSTEDKSLLDFVASQAGITLENIDLAEKMAERMEAERRASRDMEIAKEVQARLFPQKFPSLQTVEYAGRCIQARDVGGDYYDFLSLGPGRMGIVLADIVGKGIPAALLMANLQADVRSQSLIAAQNLAQFLKSVNQSFYDSTSDGTYATLFFGDYQDSTRRLRFANCGHNPPFLVRVGGALERLGATATVLGLFEDWSSSICEVEIGIGDVLVMYTDGITEAENAAGDQFGDERLLDTICANLDLSPSALLDSIVVATLGFSGGERKMKDDFTLVVARGR